MGFIGKLFGERTRDDIEMDLNTARAAIVEAQAARDDLEKIDSDLEKKGISEDNKERLDIRSTIDWTQDEIARYRESAIAYEKELEQFDKQAQQTQQSNQS